MKRSLLGELKRRNVLRAAALYLASAWLVVQIVTQLFPVYSLPVWTMRWVIGALAFGFPFWIAFAWFYELTPEGLKRESEVDPAESITHLTGRRFDLLIVVILAIAVVLLLTNTFVWREGPGLRSDDTEPVPATSIAVLPFTNTSADKNQDYFADGISEDLLNLLAKVQPLQVAARTSSFSFKGKQIGIQDIAKTLHVANVLEGSVRKVGDDVRITAQLIRASDGYQVWSQSYDRKLTDVFAIQDQIAADVAKNLKVKLLGEAPTVRETDPKAYALYLQARQTAYQKTAEAYMESNALHQQALAIDPRYAPAWVALSRNFINEMTINMLSNDEAYRAAREAADRAVAVDPSYAPAYGALSRIATKQGDLAAAAQYLHRAMQLDPSDVNILGDGSSLLMALGRLEQAIAVTRYVVTRDPVNLSSLYSLGLFEVWTKQFDAAISTFRTMLILSPGSGIAHYLTGVALLHKHDAPAALAQMQQETSEAWRLLGLTMAYHDLGRKADSSAALKTLIDKYETKMPFCIAWSYAYRREADKAFEWLHKAAQYGSGALEVTPVESLFDNIHDDPRWLPFLRSIGKAPEQLEKIEFTVTLPQAVAQRQSDPAQTPN